MHFYNMIAGLWILWLNISKHNRTIFRLKIIIKKFNGTFGKRWRAFSESLWRVGKNSLISCKILLDALQVSSRRVFKNSFIDKLTFSSNKNQPKGSGIGIVYQIVMSGWFIWRIFFSLVFNFLLTNGRMRQEEILFYYDVLLKWFKIFYWFRCLFCFKIFFSPFSSKV